MTSDSRFFSLGTQSHPSASPGRVQAFSLGMGCAMCRSHVLSLLASQTEWLSPQLAGGHLTIEPLMVEAKPPGLLIIGTFCLLTPLANDDSFVWTQLLCNHFGCSPPRPRLLSWL